MKTIMATATILLALCTSSFAQGLTVRETLEKAKKDATARLMINASADTIAWVNAHLEHEGQKPLVCLPQRMTFTPETYVSIVSSFVEKHPKAGDESIKMLNYVILQAMLYTFPCK